MHVPSFIKHTTVLQRTEHEIFEGPLML